MNVSTHSIHYPKNVFAKIITSTKVVYALVENVSTIINYNEIALSKSVDYEDISSEIECLRFLEKTELLSF